MLSNMSRMDFNFGETLNRLKERENESFGSFYDA